MNKKLDHDQVVLMAKTGLHPVAIAVRLDCSRRQVDRILKKNNAPRDGYIKLNNEDTEKMLWLVYKDWGESDAKIARRFGVSRQYVNRYFQHEEKKDLYKDIVIRRLNRKIKNLTRKAS